jgi:serine/threonine-protein kinase
MLFSVSMGDESTAQLVAQSLPTGKRTVLVDGAIDARYLPTGHLVYARSARSFDLFALAFDADTLTVSGSAVPVAQGLAPGLHTANYGVAKSGTLVYLNAPRGELTPVWVDRHGHEEPLDTCNCRQPAISPDGKRVAFSEVTSGIDILSVPEHRLMRLSFGPGGQFAPVWTLDGERVVYWSGQGLLQRRADGTGTAEPLTGPELSIPEAWTADGRLIIDSGGVANGDIDILTVTGERTREPLLATTFGESRAALSPDNRWLAYQSNESGRNEIYVRPFPDVKSGEWRVSTQGGEEPKWSRDGRSLFFLGPSSLMEAPIESGETFTWGSPKAVFDRKGYVPADVPHSYDVSPDGQRFLMIKVGTPAGATARIVVVENWSEDLKRLVPTK